MTTRLGRVDGDTRKSILETSELETLATWHNEAIFATEPEAARRLAAKIRGAPPP